MSAKRSVPLPKIKLERSGHVIRWIRLRYCGRLLHGYESASDAGAVLLREICAVHEFRLIDGRTGLVNEQRFKDGEHTSSEQRPSMGQDMQKGRHTEIEFLNSFVVCESEKVGLSCSANAVLTDIVKRVERNELKPDPRHIAELRLN
jgi:ketopantoate reductase